MDDTAVKIVHSGGEILFTTEEITSEVLQFLQDLSVNTSQLQAPTIYYDGSEYSALTLTINEVDLATYEKILALKALDEELTIYYGFASDGGASSLQVIPLVDDDEEIIIYGEMSADAFHTVKFLVSG